MPDRRSTALRVMIVEDSAVVRMLLAHIISEDPRLSVAAAVSSAEEALARLDEVAPDVISMDIRLPGMDGLEATRRIMAERPTPIVVISGAVESEALVSSMDALRAGALSVVEKPVGTTSAAYQALAREITTQLVIMSEVPVVRRRLHTPVRRRPATPARRVALAPTILGIAASTGGPQALARVLGALPGEWSVPILLVQHMGAAFMDGFARWLDGVVPQRVEIARDGERPRPGVVHVAPGDRHLLVGTDGRMRLDDSPPVRGQRPSATPLFASMAEAFGSRGAALVLTGMGDDGEGGVAKLIAADAPVFAEDAASAIVNGMPAAAVRAGAVAMPVDMIAPELVRLMAGVPA